MVLARLINFGPKSLSADHKKDDEICTKDDNEKMEDETNYLYVERIRLENMGLRTKVGSNIHLILQYL